MTDKIRKQIEKLRGVVASHLAPVTAQHALDAADTMEKMLAVVEATHRFRMMFGSTARQTQEGTDVDTRLHETLAALDQEQESDKCDHDWFTPADNDKVKWGNYQMCRKCHTIAEKET